MSVSGDIGSSILHKPSPVGVEGGGLSVGRQRRRRHLAAAEPAELSASSLAATMTVSKLISAAVCVAGFTTMAAAAAVSVGIFPSFLRLW